MRNFSNIYKELTKDKKLILNFFTQGIGQFFGRFLFFIFLMYSARVLGTKEFGIFSFALSVGYLAYTIMDFGLDHLSVKWVARERKDIFYWLAVTRVGTTVLGLMLAIIISMFFDDNVRHTLLVLSVGFVFFSLSNLSFSYFRGIEVMKWESLALTFQRCLLLLLSVFILVRWQDSIAISFAYSLSLFVLFIFAVVVFFKKSNFLLNEHRFVNVKKNVISILKEAMPLAFVSGLGVIYYKIDLIMIGGYEDMASVGVYSGAYMVIEGVMLLVRIIMAAVFPRLSQYGKNPGSMFLSFYKKLLVLLIFLSMAVTSGMYLMGDFVFNVFLGEQYINSIHVFNILLFSVIALYPGTMVTQALIAIDKQKIYMYIALVCTILNISLNSVFIPEFGINGAAWATVITDLVLTISCVLYCFIFFYKRKN